MATLKVLDNASFKISLYHDATLRNSSPNNTADEESKQQEAMTSSGGGSSSTSTHHRSNSLFNTTLSSISSLYIAEDSSSSDHIILSYMERANAHLEQSADAYSAVQDLTSALDLNPSMPIKPAVLTLRATAYFRLGSLSAALSDINSSLELLPSSIDAWTIRGDLLSADADYHPAILSYTKAINLHHHTATSSSSLQPFSSLPSLYVSRGIAYHKSTKYSEAITDFTSAIALSPPEPDLILLHRASAYLELLQYPPALEDLNITIARKPRLADAYARRADVYVKMKEYRKAYENYSTSIKLQPGNAMFHASRGNVLMKGEKYEKSILDFTRAIQLAPKVSYGFVRRGRAYFYLKDYKAAKEDLDEAMKLGEKGIELWETRALVLRKLEKLEEAVEDAGRGLKLDHENVVLWRCRGVCWHEMRELEKAVMDYDRVLELDPNDVKTRMRKTIAMKQLELMMKKKQQQEVKDGEEEAGGCGGGEDLKSLFEELGIDEKYLLRFMKNEIRIKDLVKINDDDLIALVPALGPRKRLLHYIKYVMKKQRNADEKDQEEEEEVTKTRRKRTDEAPKDLRKVPEEFLCPITFHVMEDPVVIADGHSYERKAIVKWFKMGKRRSPMTNAVLRDFDMVQNHALRQAIQRFKECYPELYKQAS